MSAAPFWLPDFAPPSSTSGAAINITASGTFNRLNAPFGQVTTLPTTDAERTSCWAPCKVGTPPISVSAC